MQADEIYETIRREKIIAIVRGAGSEQIIDIAKALGAGTVVTKDLCEEVLEARGFKSFGGFGRMTFSYNFSVMLNPERSYDVAYSCDNWSA